MALATNERDRYACEPSTQSVLHDVPGFSTQLIVSTKFESIA